MTTISDSDPFIAYKEAMRELEDAQTWAQHCRGELLRQFSDRSGRSVDIKGIRRITCNRAVFDKVPNADQLEELIDIFGTNIVKPSPTNVRKIIQCGHNVPGAKLIQYYQLRITR